jgi:hypothetical protein
MPVEGNKVNTTIKESNYHEINKFSFVQYGNPTDTERIISLQIFLSMYNATKDAEGNLISCDLVDSQFIPVEGVELQTLMAELPNGIDSRYTDIKNALYNYLQTKEYIPIGTIS